MKRRFTKNDASELRDLFNKRIEKIDPNKEAALALSGGTDSMTALLAMIDTGRHPRCYTFYMSGIISKDLLSARHACKYFGLDLTEIAVPSDIDTMYADIKRVIPLCENVKKTIVQCMIPWLYIYPAIKEEIIISGMGGDDFYATQRKLRVRYHREGDKSILNDRKWYGDDLRFSEANIIRLADKYGKKHIDFYADENDKSIEAFLLQYSFDAINKPFDKYPSVVAYADYYEAEPLYRDQTEHSYQINSRLRDCHDRLLNSRYNRCGHKAIIGLYNQIAREL